MKRKEVLKTSLSVMLTITSLVLGLSLGYVYRKVISFDKKHGTDVLANLSAAEIFQMTNAVKKVDVDNSNRILQAALSGEMNVSEVSYDGTDTIYLYLSARPDMDVVRNYIKVDPLVEGQLKFSYFTAGGTIPTIKITGDFAYRTNVTLRVMKGFPLHGNGTMLKAKGALKEDYVYTFRRNDHVPYVKFADDGRYLPPGGLGAIRLESMNVTNIALGISRVEPHNVVQLLAREEGVYSNYYSYERNGDSKNISELAGEVEESVIRCANQPNVKEKNTFAVSMKDGKPRNGIYFLNALMADYEETSPWGYYDNNIPNRRCYRLVCVSDLGLSVRSWGKEEMGVWVTSISTGKPVPNTKITIYSSARIKIMEGVTDAKGWCVPKRVDKGDAFAVIASAPNDSDMTFMALRDSMVVDETHQDGGREKYLKENELAAFLWTDRGIYRHDEKIFIHAIFRNGMRKSPRPFPVEVSLISPNGDTYKRESVMTDENGSISIDKFSVAADCPSGEWRIKASIPGGGKVFGEKVIKVEEFAPPQIRVKVEADESFKFPSFAFQVSAEHLFGSPADHLICEGAVLFEDVPFAPFEWKGWNFGNDMLGLKPSFRRIESDEFYLDKKGTLVFSAPLLASSGLPKAAVSVTAQGTVIEDGGRPVTARKSVTRHFYPFYIGSTMPGWIKLDGGKPSIKLACVTPEGKRLAESRSLTVKIDRIDSVYSYKKNERGWATWHCEHVRQPIVDGVTINTSVDKDTIYELPLNTSGDYAITITDEETRSSFGREFYLSDWGDNVVRAPLSMPTKVSITPDKAFYRVGERPRLIVKSPFTGWAMLTVMRDTCRFADVIAITNATSEIILNPIEGKDAPNVDVYLSVVQGIKANEKNLSVRAHGQTTISVRPIEDEIKVSLEGKVVLGEAGSRVDVNIAASNATEVVFTLVDEGINLLTGEETPNPIAFFAKRRESYHPLYDIYHRVLPLLDKEVLKMSGVKTGGGFGAEMLSRVSPVPTRRFKPLSLWQAKVPVVNGKASTTFKLPEFVGEVRVTAFAYNNCATGVKSEQFKVTPKLVALPDAPRFVAPQDKFNVTLPVYNRSGIDGAFSYSISANGKQISQGENLRFVKDASTNITCRIVAPNEPGEMELIYTVKGFGENHTSKIHLPVRPAVAWRETAGVKRLKPGEKFVPEAGRFSFREYDSPVGELSRSLEWLCEYPHGCLEQTVSRVFPLITAGGILSSVKINSKEPLADVVISGVKRVESMIRQNDFVMWPDVNYAPWDKEVSLYAAHFLVVALKSGLKISDVGKDKLQAMLHNWALSENNNVSAYALHTLAIAGCPEKDRMFRLYDERKKLSLISRARLARAFIEIGDRERAKTLLLNASSPSSIKEAAFALMSLLELDPDDKRILPLVAYLQNRRDRKKYSWGTTEENAHALLAIGEYYRFKPPQKGDKFVAWRRLELPKISEAKSEANGLTITRKFVTEDEKPIDITKLRRGELVYAKIEITSHDAREIGDLVITDLYTGAMEPVINIYTWRVQDQWVMRHDSRDDRMLIFSKHISLKANEKIDFIYPMRVVSSGEFTLPGVSVEAMYFPSLNAKLAPSRISVAR
jgi:uncharacterized protein YfaS (alpha-2-macroglobulin family)